MVNKAILVGRLGKDPEAFTFDNGNKKASFSLATNRSYKKDGQKVEETEWHNVTIWGKSADIAEKYLKKGSLIYLEGEIKTRSYDDKDGNKRYITEINCYNFTMLGGAANAPVETTSDDPSDGLPF